MNEIQCFCRKTCSSTWNTLTNRHYNQTDTFLLSNESIWCSYSVDLKTIRDSLNSLWSDVKILFQKINIIKISNYNIHFELLSFWIVCCLFYLGIMVNERVCEFKWIKIDMHSQSYIHGTISIQARYHETMMKLTEICIIHALHIHSSLNYSHCGKFSPNKVAQHSKQKH